MEKQLELMFSNDSGSIILRRLNDGNYTIFVYNKEEDLGVDISITKLDSEHVFASMKDFSELK